LARHNYTLKDTKTPPELIRSVEYVGLFTRVAKAEGVTPSHAIQVAKGRRKSSRVAAAIVREVRKIERLSERAA
jgi:hypothetical protein